MKRYQLLIKSFVFIAISVIVMIILPYVLVKGWETVYAKTQTQEIFLQTIENPKKAQITVLDKDILQTMVFSEFLCGVVAAEMTSGCEIEALKAQAIAAQTYIIYKIELKKKNSTIYPEHKGADICTNYNHCFAYISQEDYIAKWGESAKVGWEKIRGAVNAVYGQAILYDGKPINALFFAASSGFTEDAKDLWGTEIPYLKSVYSKWDMQIKDYKSTKEFSYTEFKNKALTLSKEIIFDKKASNWIKVMTKSKAGDNTKIKVGNQYFSGMDVRDAFELKSSNFSIETTSSKIIFKTNGFGHDVGMSQAGAQHMAENKKTYKEIIQWYYTGVKIENYSIFFE